MICLKIFFAVARYYSCCMGFDNHMVYSPILYNLIVFQNREFHLLCLVYTFFGIICTMITFLEFFHIVHAVFVYVFILKILNLLSLVIVCLTSLIFLLPVLKILSGKMHVFLKVYISFFVSAFVF